MTKKIVFFYTPDSARIILVYEISTVNTVVKITSTQLLLPLSLLNVLKHSSYCILKISPRDPRLLSEPTDCNNTFSPHNSDPFGEG